MLKGYVIAYDEQMGLLSALLVLFYLVEILCSELIHSAQKFFEENPSLVPSLIHVLNGLYTLDIVEEDAILAWRSKADDSQKKILQSVMHAHSVSQGQPTDPNKKLTFLYIPVRSLLQLARGSRRG